MMPTIICDSREQKWDHVRAYFDRCGLKWMRSKLPIGDYGRLDNLSIVIDRKAHLSEVENNLIQQHDRFRAECIRAKENGIKLIILVEAGRSIKTLSDVAGWENPRMARWQELNFAHAMGKRLKEKCSPQPPTDGKRLMQIMTTMQEKYGIEWRFCSSMNAGREICKILGIDPALAQGVVVGE